MFYVKYATSVNIEINAHNEIIYIVIIGVIHVKLMKDQGARARCCHPEHLPVEEEEIHYVHTASKGL